MNPARPRTIGIVSMVVVLLTCSLWFSTALAGSAPARSYAVRHDLRLSGAEMRGYWTRARMRAARPMPVPGDRVDGPVLAEGDGWTSARRSTSSGSVSTALQSDGSFRRTEIADPSEAPYRNHGKLFVTAGYAAYSCSATVVKSANRSVVMTAAHCLYGDDIGGWVDSIAFVPGYEDGDRPFGTWWGEAAFVTPAWISDETARGDVGAIVIEPLYGSAIVDEIGGRSIAFGESRDQVFESFGYPAEGEFDGERLFVCSDDEVLRDPNPGGTGPDTMGIGCDMTGGSSGGGWIINGTTLNSVNSYGYENAEGEALPYMFGPYFGDMAQALFEKAEAVEVDLPEPGPSETPTEVPTASPTASPTAVPTASPTAVPTTPPPPAEVPRGSTVEDADDSRGRFDISSVTVGVDGPRITIDVSTHDTWGLRLLSAAHPRNAFFVDFDSVGSLREDYYLSVFARRGRLVGRVFEYGPGRDLMVGRATMTRTTPDGFSATLSSDAINLTSTLGWYASSVFEGATQCRRGCTDYAPNASMIEI